MAAQFGSSRPYFAARQWLYSVFRSASMTINVDHKAMVSVNPAKKPESCEERPYSRVPAAPIFAIR